MEKKELDGARTSKKRGERSGRALDFACSGCTHDTSCTTALLLLLLLLAFALGRATPGAERGSPATPVVTLSPSPSLPRPAMEVGKAGKSKREEGRGTAAALAITVPSAAGAEWRGRNRRGCRSSFSAFSHSHHRLSVVHHHTAEEDGWAGNTELREKNRQQRSGRAVATEAAVAAAAP